MSKSIAKALVWFRRDLRDYDHAALYHALKSSDQVHCAFVFDTEILDLLTDEADRRVEFIWGLATDTMQRWCDKGSMHGRVAS